MRIRSFTNPKRFFRNKKYAIQNGTFISYEIVGNLYILTILTH